MPISNHSEQIPARLTSGRSPSAYLATIVWCLTAPCLTKPWLPTGFGRVAGLCFASASWICAGELLADEHPTAETLSSQSQRCRKLLETSVVDFYLPAAVDREYGGYFENIDNTGNFVGNDSKFLTLQARQLWFFSTLAQAGIRRDESLAAADHGYQFLQQYFLDNEHGGYFSKVHDDGRVLDDRKHVYLNAFALYALARYYQATQRPDVLKAAQQQFQILESKAYDRQHGGYDEFFHRDWRLIDDPAEAGYVGAVQTKTYNSHLHILEALAELYRVWPDPLVRHRLAELITVNTTTVKHSQHPCNIDGWHRDWRVIESPQNLRASYGHDVECVWLTLDAARAIERPDSLLRGWAQATVDYSLRYGYDRQHGGFFYTGPVGEPAEDRRKEWWVQAEAIVSMLEMYRLTGDPEYYRAFAETLDFIDRHQVAPGGSWWATLSAEGNVPPGMSRTSMWQGGYHNGRGLLVSAQLLDDLQRQAQERRR
ncbi:MAG: AGE family epimerase/isomerase [Pirellulales bacterium]